MPETFKSAPAHTAEPTGAATAPVQAEKHSHEHHHEHSPVQLRWLLIRNLFVAVAAGLFIASLLPEAMIGHLGHTLKAVAYFFGALAYGSEIVALTEAFHTRPPLREMFMPYVFSVLYLILGYSYLMH